MARNDPREEIKNLSPHDEGWWDALQAGSEQGAYMIERHTDENEAGEIKLRQKIEHIDWKQLKRLVESEEIVQCTVVGHNRGGLLVRHAEFEGFVPISLLLLNEKISDGNGVTESRIVSYQGRSLALRVIECDQSRGKVVLSERAAQGRAGDRKRVMASLKKGETRQGVVTNITKFGIFVDIGSIEGLVHISELSWGRVRNPKKIAALGSQVRVRVLKVDQTRSRVALSIKRLLPNPWDSVERNYHLGEVLEAEITEVVKFGAFARLEDELEGLIHLSEMNLIPGSSPWDKLERGQSVKVKIIYIDAEERRLSLALATDL